MSSWSRCATEKLAQLWRHLWLDAGDARRQLGKGGLDRLEAAVTRSEALHSGQICLCVEASLPNRSLWALLRGQPLDEIVRARALEVFTRLEVWDSEDNNGVLIYVLLAERRLELLADRGLARQLEQREWQALTDRLAPLLASSLEVGMQAAIEAVHALLVDNYATKSGQNQTTGETAAKTLPDRPQLI